MINGIYRFISDGKVIAEQKNALTDIGRTIAIKSLLGIVPNFGGVIACGIGNNPNDVDPATNLISDNALNFEIARTPVIGSSLNMSNSSDILVYSGTIDSTSQYQIYEVGLYPGGLQNTNADVAGSTLFDFDRVDLFNKIGTASAAALVESIEARIGNQLFELPPTDGTDSYLSYAAANGNMAVIDNYVSLDTFRLAGFNLHSVSSSISFRFYADQNNYFTYTFYPPSSSGYFITTLEKSAAVIIGNPSWLNITDIRIWNNSASVMYLDALKIDVGPYLKDTLTGMISRAVLAEPLKKPASIPLTIEYSLSLGFNQIGS